MSTESLEHIHSLFDASINAKLAAKEDIPRLLIEAGDLLTQTLLHEGKILTCGNGGPLAMHNIFPQKCSINSKESALLFPQSHLLVILQP